MSTGHFRRVGLDLKVDARDFFAAGTGVVAGALAKLGEADVAILAKFQARGDEDAIDIDAVLALKLEEHVDESCVVGSPAQHPASAPENCAGKGLNKAGRLLNGDSLHLHRPGNAQRLSGIIGQHASPHRLLIGEEEGNVNCVQELNGW